MIELKNIYKSFGRNEVLKGVSASISKGEVVCIIGPSGSGKSTILRCINGLERYNAGEITIDNVLVDNQKKDIGLIRAQVAMVFQKFNLFPHRTALENVIEGPIYVKGENRETATKRGRDLLASVGLADKEHEYPPQLSGGQQQRVAIARALAGGPSVILADEPTGNLDSARSHEIMRLLQTLNQEDGITVVMVTHEEDIAAYARRLMVFTDGHLTRDEPVKERA